MGFSNIERFPFQFLFVGIITGSSSTMLLTFTSELATVDYLQDIAMTALLSFLLFFGFSLLLVGIGVWGLYLRKVEKN